MSKVLVVAHPDDEILFFSSILQAMDKIVFCFSKCESHAISIGRQEVQTLYPLPNTEWLNLDEADVFGEANWNKPAICDFGLVVGRNADRYRKNFDVMTTKLSDILEGFDEVYTHNPWGEYGHEEHVSVFQAVVHVVKQNSGARILVSGYVSDHSRRLFLARKGLLDGFVCHGVTPIDLCDRLKHLYVKNKCWTWNDNYQWPTDEIFLEIRRCGIVEPPDGSGAHPPVMYFSKSFRFGRLKRALNTITPQIVKLLLFRFLHKWR